MINWIKVRFEFPIRLSTRAKVSASHTRTMDGQKVEWFVEDLWRLARTLPIDEVDPAVVIDLDRDGWFTREKPTPRSILNHMRRILDSDLSYPVILHPDGSIMDGAHRACKAILFGKEKIRVVRFSEQPKPSLITPIGEY